MPSIPISAAVDGTVCAAPDKAVCAGVNIEVILLNWIERAEFADGKVKIPNFDSPTTGSSPIHETERA